MAFTRSAFQVCVAPARNFNPTFLSPFSAQSHHLLYIVEEVRCISHGLREETRSIEQQEGSGREGAAILSYRVYIQTPLVHRRPIRPPDLSLHSSFSYRIDIFGRHLESMAALCVFTDTETLCVYTGLFAYLRRLFVTAEAGIIDGGASKRATEFGSARHATWSRRPPT